VAPGGGAPRPVLFGVSVIITPTSLGQISHEPILTERIAMVSQSKPSSTKRLKPLKTLLQQLLLHTRVLQELVHHIFNKSCRII
jgi:hypothetical protein